MTSTNPYEPPTGTSLAYQPQGSMMLAGLAVVSLAAAVGALGGLCLGIFIAFAFPGYYQAVFTPNVNPFQVGAGLGLVQGTIAGLVVGLILVIIHYIYRLRWTREYWKHAHQQPPSE